MNNTYWESFYKEYKENEESSFARYVLQYIDKKGVLVDFGCGNGRDLKYFLKQNIKSFGVDESFVSEVIENQNVIDFIKFDDSPEYVYTRFFWHAISRPEQLTILKWVKDYIFIEARTTEDEQLPKVFPAHDRNYVNVPRLVKDLKDKGFQIISLNEGHFSPYKGENPHLVRIVARKKNG